VAYFVKALLCALCHPYMHSGVTGSLSQEWKNLAEGAHWPLEGATTEHSEKKAKK